MIHPIPRGLSLFLLCAVVGLGAGCREPNMPLPAAPMGVNSRVEIPTGAEPAVIGEAAAASSSSGYTPALAQTKVDLVTEPARPEKPAHDEVTTSSGLKYQILVDGTGAEAKAGQKVYVHYTGTFENGEKFDSSRDRNKPLDFVLGSGQVIRGWDEGVAGMKVGERRLLKIPSDLAYGPTGKPPIPPNTPLVFDVSLLGVE